MTNERGRVSRSRRWSAPKTSSSARPAVRSSSQALSPASPRVALLEWRVDRWSEARIAVVLALLSAVLLFLGLGRQDLWDWDESVYAQVSKEMIQTGDWLTTRWAQQLFFDKPPLYMWFEAILFQTVGISELTARAPSALSGVGLVLVTFLLGRLAYGRLTGILAALILLSTHGFLFYARFATLDTTLSFFSLLAIYAYARARRGDQRWRLLMGAAIGLAVMTKGAGAFPAIAAIAIGLLVDVIGNPEARHRASLLAIIGGGAIALLVAIPWHLYMYVAYGQPFIDGYIGLIVEKAVGSGQPKHFEDLFYYLSILARDFFPWLFLLPVSIALGLADARRRSSISVVLIAMTILLFGIYSASPVKLPWYLVPLYPPAAILVAGFISNRRCRPRVTVGLTAACALVAVLLASISTGLYEIITPRVGYLFVLLTACAGVAIVWNWRRPPFVAARVLSLLALFLLLASANAARSAFVVERGPVATLARAAATSAGEPLVVLDHFPSALFYSGRPVDFLDDYANLTARLNEGRPFSAILRKEVTQQLSSCCEVTPLAESDGYVYAKIARRAASP